MVLCFFLSGFRALVEPPRHIYLFTWLCPQQQIPRSLPTQHIHSSQHLDLWCDLLFGDTQQRPPALDALMLWGMDGEKELPCPSGCRKE